MIANEIQFNIATLLGQLSVEERWRAVRKTPDSSYGMEWLLFIVILMVVAICIGLVVMYLRGRKKIRASWEIFDVRTQELGMIAEEEFLLETLIETNNIKEPTDILVMDTLFRDAVENYLETKAFREHTGGEKLSTFQMFGAIRQKLGLGPRACGKRQSSSRQISEGTEVLVGQIGSDHYECALVDHSTYNDLCLRFASQDHFAGETSIYVRFFDGRSLWDFEAPIISENEDGLLISHVKRMRFVNLRRFVRVPVNRRAKVSAFPFRTEAADMNPLSFITAQLTEVGGPGLRLETPLPAKAGDHLLVILELDGNTVVQAIGVVRRTYESHHLNNVYGIELVGLAPAQIAELTHITNAAAIHQAHDEDNAAKIKSAVRNN